MNIYTGEDKSLGALERGQACPKKPSTAMELARRWHRENWFINPVIQLRTAFYNYGFKLVPAGKPTAAARQELEKWLAGDVKKTGERAHVEKLVRFSLSELQLLDNSVALWRDYSAPAWRGSIFASRGVTPAYLEKPEECQFSDKFNLEVLKLKPDVTYEEMKERGFPDNAIRRYTQGEIQLDPEKWGEHFRVLRRDGFDGFAYPALNSVFKVLSQNESMEVGEQALAMLGRNVVRLWKTGFEPKVTSVGQNAKHWKYDDKSAAKWEKHLKGLVGGMSQSVVQFDRKAEDVWVDVKHYNGQKWETILNRLMWWGGPLAFMMMAKSVSPFLLGMLKTLAQADRALVAPHVVEIIHRSFRPPFAVAVEWSDECFNDSRLAWDQIKFLMTQGPASLTTGLRKAGLDPLQEDENKRDEKGRKADLLPLLMPGKGNDSGGGSRAGRQQGVPDNSAVD